MQRLSSDVAGSNGSIATGDENPMVFPARRNANLQHPSAIADGLWNQAQAVFGAIARAKNETNHPVRTVGLTSCYRQEGVSTVAAVLALAAACQRKVLLVDANLTHPSLDRRFRVKTTPGLLQLMDGQATPGDCIQASPLGVSVVSAGCAEGPAATFLRPDRVLSVLQTFTPDFDLVLVDLPAAGDDSSALELSGVLDGVVLVVESERVHWQAGQRTVSRLQQSGVRLIGAVFNKRRDYTPDWLYRVL